IAARRKLVAAYRAALPGVRFVAEEPGATHVYHLLVVRLADRDGAQRRLAEAGVDTQIHYPTPIHLQPAFAHLGQAPGSCPVAERAASEILSLPLYPELPLEAIERVAAVLRK